RLGTGLGRSLARVTAAARSSPWATWSTNVALRRKDEIGELAGSLETILVELCKITAVAESISHVDLEERSEADALNRALRRMVASCARPPATSESSRRPPPPERSTLP